MEPISIRYGESLTLPINAGDVTAVHADIYIGRPGEAYTLTKGCDLDLGEGVFTFTPDEIRIPVGEYSYQINVTDTNGYIEKYPSPEVDCGSCEDEFPQFIVREALDEQEVV